MLAASVKEDLSRIQPVAICAYNASSGKFEYLESDQQGNQFGILRASLTPPSSDFTVTTTTVARPILNLNTTNLTQVIATPSRIFSFEAFNLSAAVPCCLNFYNALSASVTVGTTRAYKRYWIPANSGIKFQDNFGIIFTTAISVALQTLSTETDTTAVAADSFFLNLNVGNVTNSSS